MKKITMFLVFAVFAFLVSCGGSEGSGSGGSGDSNVTGETGSIYGIVTDKATGESIINAGVELQPIGLKTVTGSDGQFEFNEVATGTYTLFVTKTGYSDSSSDITVESGKQSKGDVQLEKLPAALRIVDDDGKDISELDFGEKLADVSRQFNIFNDGTEKLKWELSFSADWIKSVSKEGGELKAGGTQGVIVNIDRSLLESGENVTTIHVTSNDGNKQLTVKATNATVLPTLNTLETTNITSSSAVLNAEILTKGVPSYSERGFVYALESNPTLENTIAQLTAKVSEENLYSATVTGLELGEEY
ncbi:carboxypeptidase regulatory-like domain-containing protein, partial [bacterium]|nr:carboxypeptidase regulatory-like domain-containing protein [bacterium]